MGVISEINFLIKQAQPSESENASRWVGSVLQGAKNDAPHANPKAFEARERARGVIEARNKSSLLDSAMPPSVKRRPGKYVKSAGWFGSDEPKGPTLGKPEWKSLPSVLTNLADTVGTDTKNVQVPSFNYDDIDSAVAYDILKSPEAGELFSKRDGEYRLDWGPARDAVKAVSPGFAKEMFSWSSLLHLAGLKEALSGMDRDTAVATMDQILRWADANPNHKKILVGAVKNRNEQAAKIYPNKKYPDLKFPTWDQRRAAYAASHSPTNAPQAATMPVYHAAQQ